MSECKKLILVALMSTLPVPAAWGAAHAVTLNWKAQRGMVYNVYRCDAAGKDCKKIGNRVKTAKFVDRHVTAGETYHYKVTAVDSAHRESIAAEKRASVPRD